MGFVLVKEWVILTKNVASYFLVTFEPWFCGEFSSQFRFGVGEHIFVATERWRSQKSGDEGEISHEKAHWSAVTAPQ